MPFRHVLMARRRDGYLAYCHRSNHTFFARHCRISKGFFDEDCLSRLAKGHTGQTDGTIEENMVTGDVMKLWHIQIQNNDTEERHSQDSHYESHRDPEEKARSEPEYWEWFNTPLSPEEIDANDANDANDAAN